MAKVTYRKWEKVDTIILAVLVSAITLIVVLA